MKQIPFTLEAFTPDGMLKDGYELIYGYKTIKYALYNQKHNRIAVVFYDATSMNFDESYDFTKEFKLYRRTRTPEEVAKEIHCRLCPEENEKWVDLLSVWSLFYTALVQAGMDEMK